MIDNADVEPTLLRVIWTSMFSDRISRLSEALNGSRSSNRIRIQRPQRSLKPIKLLIGSFSNPNVST